MHRLKMTCLLGAIVLFALVGVRPTRAEPKPLRVGVISGLSGIATKWNRYQNMGIELAQSELAAQGQKIELIVEDSQTQGAKVLTAFNKLLDFDHVDAIIADDFGFAVAPLLPLLKRRKTLLYAVSLPQDHYCVQGGEYFFSGTSQFVYSRDAFERFFVLHPEVKKIALATFDDPEWGNTYHKIWTEVAQARGVTIVDDFVTPEFTLDFVPVIARFIQKGAQAIFVAHEPENFFKALRQLQYQGLIVFANCVLEMLADHDSRVEIEGTYTVDPEISADFKKRFYDKYKHQPILEAYAGYEALRAVAAAFKQNPEQPQLAMKQLSYDGVAGRMDFTGKSCAGNLAHWGLFRFENGQQTKQ